MRRRLLALSLLALPLLAACTGKDAPATSAAGTQTSASATGSDSPSATPNDSATGTATDSPTGTGTGTATDSPTGATSSGASSTEAPSPTAKPLRYFFSIQNGQILGPARVSMHVGQTVELRFATDRNATIHAHGFDVTKQLTAGVTDSMFVTATAPGSFNVEDHSTSKLVTRIAVS